MRSKLLPALSLVVSLASCRTPDPSQELDVRGLETYWAVDPARGETQYLAPFFRYEHFDTQQHVPSGLVRDATKDTELYTVGLTYKPHPQIVLKLDYRNFQQAQGERADDVNFGAGFVF